MGRGGWGGTILVYPEDGTELEAEVDVSPGWRGDRWSPPEPAEVEIGAIYLDGVQVKDLNDREALLALHRDEIEELALERYDEFLDEYDEDDDR